jgi:Flp pilus assembly protein TadG
MLRDHGFNPIRRRRGSALAVLAVSLVLIIGVMAVTIDGGLLMAERRHAQSVADATAYAAAGSLYNNYATDKGLDRTGAVKNTALAIAAGNGYANDGTTSTVTVNIPPLSGPFTGTSGYAEVLVSYSQPKLFSALWGAGTMSVTARTTARGIAIASDIGLLLLDPSMNQSLSVRGNGAVNFPNGRIVVNSSNSTAVDFRGNNAIVTALETDITGGISDSKGGLRGPLKTGVVPTPDPFASLPVPDPASMPVRTATGTVLNPGRYVGGINLSNSGAVTLNPGVYYLDGGGLSFNGSGSVTGTGVIFYNAPKTSSDTVNLSPSGALTLTPPTTGTYRGIEIFQDRTSTVGMSMAGNGSMAVNGTIYAAKAEIDLTGNTTNDSYGSQIIVNNIQLTGNGTITINKPAGTPTPRQLQIVE